MGCERRGCARWSWSALWSPQPTGPSWRPGSPPWLLPAAAAAPAAPRTGQACASVLERRPPPDRCPHPRGVSRGATGLDPRSRRARLGPASADPRRLGAGGSQSRPLGEGAGAGAQPRPEPRVSLPDWLDALLPGETGLPGNRSRRCCRRRHTSAAVPRSPSTCATGRAATSTSSATRRSTSTGCSERLRARGPFARQAAGGRDAQRPLRRNATAVPPGRPGAARASARAHDTRRRPARGRARRPARNEAERDRRSRPAARLL